MIRICFTCYLMCFYTALCAQDISIKIIPVLNGQKIELDRFYKININDSIEFINLKFYISSIQFFYNNKLTFEESSSYHLIDLSKQSTTAISIKNIPNIKYNTIRFNLGIDSVTNVSGAFGADLDPTNGMYWTWQNGYINFKMEGKSNLSTNKNAEFEFHLGGYQYPYNSLQTIKLKLKNKQYIKIGLTLNEFFKFIDLATQKNIMSPSASAVNLSKNIAHLFFISK